MWAFLLVLLGCPGTKNADAAAPGGCDPGETTLASTCACETPTVVIGSGATTYEAVSDGTSVTMVHGPQGGWHVLGSAQMANLLPIVTIHYTVQVEPEGTLVSDNTYRVQMVMSDECTGFYPGMYGYLNVSGLAEGDLDTPPELLAGRELRLQMDVSDVEGRVTTDTLSVIAALDPLDEPEDSGSGDSGGP